MEEKNEKGEEKERETHTLRQSQWGSVRMGRGSPMVSPTSSSSLLFPSPTASPPNLKYNIYIYIYIYFIYFEKVNSLDVWRRSFAYIIQN